MVFFVAIVIQVWEYRMFTINLLYQKSKSVHILTFIINIKQAFKDMTTGILITFYLQLQYKSKAGLASATIFCNIVICDL